MIDLVVQDAYGMYLTLMRPREAFSAVENFLKAQGPEGAAGAPDHRSLDYQKFCCYNIELVSPLQHLHINFYSNGRYFHGDGRICRLAKATAPKSFKDFLKNFNEKNLIPVYEGVLMVQEQIPRFFFSSGGVDAAAIVSFGTRGTAQMKLGTFEQFKEDIQQFTSLLAQAVNACYKTPTPDIIYQINLLRGDI